jgi:DNA-binding SARP family transcriptional activator
MEFKVLGPLQVADGARVVAVGGPMQRAVLALLILDTNRVVSMEQLIYGLWGEDPPARATGTVHAYVSNLRRALEPERRPGEPARVLVSQAPGYVLRASPDDVDWLRFERLLDRARKARAGGDLPAAGATLAEARALWRGPPLADLTEIAMPERARLDGLRLSAFEEHVEVLLALGRHFAASQRRAASNRWAAGHGHNPGKRRLRPFPELFVSAPGYRQPRIAERRGRCRWTPGLRSRTGSYSPRADGGW